MVQLVKKILMSLSADIFSTLKVPQNRLYAAIGLKN